MAAATPARGQCSPQELAKLIASDAAAEDWFGWSVAVSGDTAVVGAFHNAAAYVFVLSGGVWTQQAKLTPSDGVGYGFGWSVAVWGDTAVVGARDDHPGGVLYAGSAYVFVRSGGVWTQQAKLIASDAAESDAFGSSVALWGDTAVAGAYGDDQPGGFNEGSAYLFIRSGAVWTQQAKLTASDAGMDDTFGNSAAMDGDTVLVGAYRDTGAPGWASGSTYVFVKLPGGWTTMTETAKLTASDAQYDDRFGYSVALSGDTAVIGAESDDHTTPGGFNDAGSAYVFVGSGGVWTEQAKLIASDQAAQDYFGHSVAVSGDTAVVGAFLDDLTGVDFSYEGSAYVFVRTGGVWTQQAKLAASDAAVDDLFGHSVALSGDTAAVGAFREDNAGGAQAGSAYAFDLGCVAAFCAGDFDGDNMVTNADIPDFLTALLIGGACPALPTTCPGDLNADGTVDGADMPGFLAKLFAGGACP